MHKILTQIILLSVSCGFVYFATHATAIAAYTDCPKCYSCVRWGSSGCMQCEYDATSCELDVPYDPDMGCKHIGNLYDYFENNTDVCSTYYLKEAYNGCDIMGQDPMDCRDWVDSYGDFNIINAYCNSNTKNEMAMYMAQYNGYYSECMYMEDVEITDWSDWCRTIYILNQNCAQYVVVESQDTIGGYNYVNCDGNGTTYSYELLSAMCENDETCMNMLSNNWDFLTDALCNSSDGYEIADQIGFNGWECDDMGYPLVGIGCEGCDNGYYYDYGMVGCYECPKLGNTSAGSYLNDKRAPISSCFMPAQTNITDTTGTFQFTNECPYTP